MRAWIERGSAEPLRATIKTPAVGSEGPGETKTVTSPEAGGEAVKQWLEDVEDEDKRDEAAEQAGKDDNDSRRTNPVPK